MKVSEINERRVSISRVEEVFGWLGHQGAGGESLPDRAWRADVWPDQPGHEDRDEMERAA